MAIERTRRTAQFTLGFSELEWLGYKAWYREGVERGQLLPDVAECSTPNERTEKGPTLEG
jgi:hypothetical protein